MIKWAGWLFVFYGTAHTLGALTVEQAAQHAGAWFSGALWHDDFATMSAANSAYWFSLGSFGIPLIIIGLTVLWLDRRGITPPAFIGWTIGIWNAVDAIILVRTPWPIILVAVILLLTGIQRAHRNAAGTVERSGRSEAQRLA